VACDLRKRLAMGRVLPAWLCGCARLWVAVCGWLRQMHGQVARGSRAGSTGSNKRWTYKSGNLVMAPVVNNGVVYVGGSSGRVYGVSARSGAQVWSAAAGPYIVPSVELVGPPIGMGGQQDRAAAIAAELAEIIGG
jgi:hypothetical protein